MSLFETRAAHLLDVGDVVLVTPELGRHRRQSIMNHRTTQLTVKAMQITVGHNVHIWLTSGEDFILPEGFLVKVAV